MICMDMRNPFNLIHTNTKGLLVHHPFVRRLVTTTWCCEGWLKQNCTTGSLWIACGPQEVQLKPSSPATAPPLLCLQQKSEFLGSPMPPDFCQTEHCTVAWSRVRMSMGLCTWYGRGARGGAGGPVRVHSAIGMVWVHSATGRGGSHAMQCGEGLPWCDPWAYHLCWCSLWGIWLPAT